MKKILKLFIVIAILLVAISGCHKAPLPKPDDQVASINIEADSNLTMTRVMIKINLIPHSSTIIEAGVCYSTDNDPTTANDKVVSNIQTGVSTLSLNDLSNNTKYYLKAYVVTAEGITIYSPEKMIWTYALMDYDGNGYHAVTIGTQTFTLENLKVTHYCNGDPIPEIQDSIEWYSYPEGARCYYDNNKAKYNEVHGALYNLNAAQDSRKLAPKGWHIPSLYEYNDLSIYLGKNSVAGGKMKEAGTEHWNDPNTGASNSSGFTALASGSRARTVAEPTVVTYHNFRYRTYFWCTAKEVMPNTGSFLILYHDSTWLAMAVMDKNSGFSVRLIKD